MKKSSVSDLLKLFVIWRVSLFLISFLAIFFIPTFGARFPYFRELMATELPQWFWSFGNFDGVYYLRIAQSGYADQFSQAFFPLYSLLIKIFSPDNLYFVTGLILSNLFFLAALWMVYKLFSLDWNHKIVWKSIILLLAFPTSFYFGAVYSESLFLLLTLTTIYLVRKKHFLAGGLFAALASGTRIFGLLLVPFMVIELYLSVKAKEIKVGSEEFLKAVIGLLVAPLGTLLYMLYLKLYFNDPLYFLSAQPHFGAERSDQPFVLLPQVLFRYLKIFTTVSIENSAFWNALLEFTFTVIPLILLIIWFKKIRFSYWIFLVGCLLLPTLTGTLSSMPRYVLNLFLILPLLADFKYYKILIACFVILGFILISLFTRGYWVS